MKRLMTCGLIALLLSAGGTLFAADSGKPLVVGSKIDTEGSLLGKMIVKLLAAKGIPVVDKVGFGTTDRGAKGHHRRRARPVPRVHGQRGLLLRGDRPDRLEGREEGLRDREEARPGEERASCGSRPRPRTTRGRSRCARTWPTSRSSSRWTTWRAYVNAGGKREARRRRRSSSPGPTRCRRSRRPTASR